MFYCANLRSATVSDSYLPPLIHQLHTTHNRSIDQDETKNQRSSGQLLRYCELCSCEAAEVRNHQEVLEVVVEQPVERLGSHPWYRGEGVRELRGQRNKTKRTGGEAPRIFEKIKREKGEHDELG